MTKANKIAKYRGLI